jgi:hypothetical protein
LKGDDGKVCGRTVSAIIKTFRFTDTTAVAFADE